MFGNLRDTITTTKASLTKNLITTQTYTHITTRLNTAGQAFNSDGLGTGAASTTSMWIIHMGGWNDQYIQAQMKYVSPTTQANSEIGVMLRFQTFEQTSDTSYYYARVDGGIAKLTKVVAGVFTNLSTANFALPQNQYCTITFQVVGSALTATFHDNSSTLSDVTLTATDSSITTGGLHGIRSLSSSIATSMFTINQL